jgi:hypothetical protein
LTNTTGAAFHPVSISYRLNQPATGGVTVNILQGSNVVQTIAAPAAMGTNSVAWTPSTGGTFSVSITAAAAGFPLWTQISIDTNAGMPVNYPLGMDVDRNTNSPYYGRVIVGCAYTNLQSGSVPAAALKTGLYKMNADGSQADEGWYGNANYLADDAGDVPVPGQMPNSSGSNPVIIRIGEDDRIYWCDNTSLGAVVACDMQATTNQVVIDDGLFGNLGGPNNYTGNPDLNDLDYGIQHFDITGTTTASAAVWLCDVDSPNWGIWMYHLKKGAADPADTEGTQAVIVGGVSDLNLGSSGGCMIDSNLDIFVSQNLPTNGPPKRTMEYTNWNNSILPPKAEGSAYAFGKATNQVMWSAGGSDATFCGVRSTVINSRAHPTFIALPMIAGVNNTFYGIRVLNAANGSVVSVTNGSTVQTLTNIDYTEQYTCAAWDNVGNLYGASTTRNVWRVWSPPGANSATTVAVAQIIVPVPFAITSYSAVPAAGGCSTVTIHFTYPGNLSASSFKLMSSTSVNGAYKAVSGATITGSAGVYQATCTSCSTEYFVIEE